MEINQCVGCTRQFFTKSFLRLPTSNFDFHTGLNAVIAGFSHGKKVEIEFLQLRVDVESRGKLTISHMLKITELSEEAEAKLIKEFPTPEVMELKPGTHSVALEVSKKNSKKRGAPEPSDGHAHEHAA